MSIFQKNDYKEILKALAGSSEPGKRGFYRRLADHLNVNPSLISQVLSGDKDFTEEQIVLVCEYLGLPPLESRYILMLLQIQRTGSVKLKSYYQTSIDELRTKALDLSQRINVARKLNDSEKAKFYSSWLYSAIHLMTTLKPSPKFQDICKRFSISQNRAQEIVGFLLDIGLIVENNSRYIPGPTTTHLEKSSPEVTQVHKNWRQKAMDAAEDLDSTEYMYSCSFTISKKDFMQLREELTQTTKKFLSIVEHSDPEDLAQLNIDLFWLRN